MNQHKNILTVTGKSDEEVAKIDLDQVELLMIKVDEITSYIRRELHNSHAVIKELQERNRELMAELKLKKNQADQYAEKLQDSELIEQGKHQLVEKLLGDINRYQIELDWYKRTYEKRSFFGLIKDRFSYSNKRVL